MWVIPAEQEGLVGQLVQVGARIDGIIQGGSWVEIILSLSLFPAESELGSQMTAVARRSYFTFSLAVKEDEVITMLEWQLGSEEEEGRSK